MRPRAHDEGLKEELSYLAKDAGKFLQVRGELLAIESKEAATIIRKKGSSLAIAGSLASIAYLLFLAAAIGLLGHYFSTLGEGVLYGWMGAALALGTCHFLLALVFILKNRSSAKEPLFEYSRREWAKDQSWIKEDIAKKS